MMDLMPILEDLGIEGARERGDEITALCPMHEERVGRPDHNASWSINTETGAFQCFSCGFKGRSLSYLYEAVTGNVPDHIHKMTQTAEMGAVERKLTDALTEREESEPQLKVGELVPVPRRMLASRKLLPESAEALGVKWDKDSLCWYVPVITPKGKLLGAQLKQAGNFLNVPPNVEKSTTLFGFNPAYHANTVAVVESPLDVVRLHGAGIPAVSTFGAGVSDEQVSLLKDWWIRIVLWMDNDEAGEKATEYLKWRLKHKAVMSVKHLSYKDPGEFETDEELKELWQQTLNPLSRFARTK